MTKRFKVYYSIKGVRYSTIVTAECGSDAQDYVQNTYGPCKIIGLEEL